MGLLCMGLVRDRVKVATRHALQNIARLRCDKFNVSPSKGRILIQIWYNRIRMHIISMNELEWNGTQT